MDRLGVYTGGLLSCLEASAGYVGEVGWTLHPRVLLG